MPLETITGAATLATMDGLVGVVEDWLGDCEAADDCKQLYECLQSDLDRLTHAIYTLCDERSR